MILFDAYLVQFALYFTCMPHLISELFLRKMFLYNNCFMQFLLPLFVDHLIREFLFGQICNPSYMRTAR